jgi:hypothetical protein
VGGGGGGLTLRGREVGERIQVVGGMYIVHVEDRSALSFIEGVHVG